MTASELMTSIVKAIPEFRPSDPDLTTVTCDQLMTFLADESHDPDQSNFALHLPLVS